MKKIYINFKTNEYKFFEGNQEIPISIFELEHNATIVEVDYRDTDYSSWTKVIDFEDSKGTKTQFRLGEEPVVSMTLPSALMVEGNLKINPLALHPSDTGVDRASGKTYVFKVHNVVNAFNEEYDGSHSDVITLIYERLEDIELKADNALSVTNDLKERIDDFLGTGETLEQVFEGTVSDLNTRIDDSFDSLSNSVSSLSNEVDSIGTEVNTLSGEVGTIGGQVTSVQGKVNSLETKTQEIEGDISSLETRKLDKTVFDDYKNQTDNALDVINDEIDFLDSISSKNRFPVSGRQFKSPPWIVHQGAQVKVTPAPIAVFNERYSRNLFTSGGWESYPGYAVILESDGTKRLLLKEIPNNIISTVIALRNNGYKTEAGTFTFSGFVKIDGEIPTESYFKNISNFGGSGSANLFYNTKTGYFSITQTVTSNSWTIHATTTKTATSEREIELTNIKYEKGNIATEWTPAWEDLPIKDKPVSYIETTGGTGTLKYYLSTLSPKDAVNKEFLQKLTVRNVGDTTLKVGTNRGRSATVPNDNSLKDLGIVIPAIPNEVAWIQLRFETLNASDSLKFYAYNPQLYLFSEVEKYLRSNSGGGISPELVQKINDTADAVEVLETGSNIDRLNNFNGTQLTIEQTIDAIEGTDLSGLVTKVEFDTYKGVTDTHLENVDNQIDDINTSLDSIDNRLNNFKNSNKNVETYIEDTISSLSTDISNVESSVTAVQGSITSLGTRTTALENKNQTIESDIDDLSDDIASINSSLQTISADASQAKADASQAKADATQAKADALQAKNDATQAKTDVDNLSDTVDNAQTSLANTTNRVEYVENTITQNLTPRIVSLEEAIEYDERKIGIFYYKIFRSGLIHLYAKTTAVYQSNIALQATVNFPFYIKEIYTAQASKIAGFLGQRWQRCAVGISPQVPHQNAIIRAFAQGGDQFVSGDTLEIYIFIAGKYAEGQG